jgi:hypothetical protein
MSSRDAVTPTAPAPGAIAKAPGAAWRLAAVALALAVTTALLLTALLGRTVEHPLENDSYHIAAEKLLSGTWPRDVYRPLLYHLLTAALTPLVGDSLHAGMAVSAAATGIAVWLVFEIAVLLTSPAGALLASALLAGNGAVLQHGISCSTDALFLATFGGGLLALMRLWMRRDRRAAFVAGAAFGLAYFSRYTALALLPALALGCLAPPAATTRMVRSLAAAAGAFVALLPHFTISMLQFGRPLYDETWRNLALRHFGPKGDFRYLNDNPFDGALSVLRHDPATVWAHFVEEGKRVLLLRVPGFGAPPTLPGLAWLMTPALLLGLGLALRRRPAAAMPLLLSTAVYGALVASTFYAWERMMLPLQPCCHALTALGLAAALEAVLAAWPRQLLVPGRIAAAGLLLTPWTLGAVSQTRAFVAGEAADLVAAARKLCSAAPGPLRLLSNFPHLRRHVAAQTCTASPPDSAADPAQALLGAVLVEAPTHVLFSRQFGFATWKQIADARWPDFVQPGLRDARLLTLSIRRQELDMLLAAPPRLRALDDGQVELLLPFDASLPPGLRVFACWRRPWRQPILQEFVTTSRGDFRVAFARPDDHPMWRCALRVVGPDGSLHAGPELQPVAANAPPHERAPAARAAAEKATDPLLPRARRVAQPQPCCEFELAAPPAGVTLVVGLSRRLLPFALGPQLDLQLDLQGLQAVLMTPGTAQPDGRLVVRATASIAHGDRDVPLFAQVAAFCDGQLVALGPAVALEPPR